MGILDVSQFFKEVSDEGKPKSISAQSKGGIKVVPASKVNK